MQPCCLTIADVDSVTFSGGRMSFLNVGGDTLAQFDLSSLIANQRGNRIMLKDRHWYYNFTEDQATAMGITFADIVAAISATGGGGSGGNVNTTVVQYTSGTQTLTGGTYHSVSIYVHAGTVEVNGVAIPTGVTLGWSAPGTGLIADNIVLGNFAGATVLVTTSEPA